jgi:predicted nucleic acid-binding protein
MKNIHVFDACALIAYINNEKGADIVDGLLEKAANGEITILMHKLNFLEVYYYIQKKFNESAALKFYEDIKISPIKLNTEITDNILIRAGRLKSMYKISLADSIGLAEAIINNGSLVSKIKVERTQLLM